MFAVIFVSIAVKKETGRKLGKREREITRRNVRIEIGREIEKVYNMKIWQR